MFIITINEHLGSHTTGSVVKKTIYAVRYANTNHLKIMWSKKE